MRPRGGTGLRGGRAVWGGALLACAAAAACGGGGGDPPVSPPPAAPTVRSVTVAGSATMQVGDRQQLVATVDASGGAATTVTWSSEAPAVATVSADGVAIAGASAVFRMLSSERTPS